MEQTDNANPVIFPLRSLFMPLHASSPLVGAGHVADGKPEHSGEGCNLLILPDDVSILVRVELVETLRPQ